MKIIKILGIAAGLHALALILIFSNPGCTYTKAAGPDAPPIAPAPLNDSSAPASAADTTAIRYSPTRPGTAVAAALETEPVSGVVPATTYTVAKGDSLWTIAKKHQMSRGDLASANNLNANATLRIGQKLIIPSKSNPSGVATPPAAPAATAAILTAPAAGAPPAGSAVSGTPEKPAGGMLKHVVKAGETLGGIARRYGVRQGDIAVANNITDPRKIHPGQELSIPARAAVASSKQAKGARPAPVAAIASNSQPPAAGGDQDLDAGLKPPTAADVPVVKIEDAPAATQTKNP